MAPYLFPARVVPYNVQNLSRIGGNHHYKEPVFGSVTCATTLNLTLRSPANDAAIPSLSTPINWKQKQTRTTHYLIQ